jgi:glycosyltransferase A (GT-A) superfamily protein (DUF2064 family)
MQARGDRAQLRTVIVIAKEPVPGRVKTRLVPPLTHQQAADLAAAAIADTLRAAAGVPADRHLLVLDGRPPAWLPAGWPVVAQVGGGLDARLVAAFEAAGPGPAILVGMDTPQLRADQLSAFDPVAFDACLGLAHDGGYWVIGYRDPALARLTISGVPMSRDDTGARQLERLTAAGLRVQLLDELTDVDTYPDAVEVAAAAPDSGFAAALAAIDLTVAALDLTGAV